LIINLSKIKSALILKNLWICRILDCFYITWRDIYRACWRYPLTSL